MGCEIVTVSTDTQFTHLAWQRSEKELANVRYSMGADPTAKVPDCSPSTTRTTASTCAAAS
jgi:alkyl hydroperoxide reductase subunit AhpC